MAKLGTGTVTIRVVDEATPALLALRYRFLTPIGHKVPPKGTMHRQMLELQVRMRQAGRAIAATIPGGSQVNWREAGARWDRWLQAIGVAYLAFAAGVTVWLLVNHLSS